MTARRCFTAHRRCAPIWGGLVCAVTGALGLGCGVNAPDAASAGGGAEPAAGSAEPAAEPACTTVAAGGAWWNQAFSQQGRRFHVELDATPSASPIDAVIGLGAGSASDFAQLGAIVRFSPAGTI